MWHTRKEWRHHAQNECWRAHSLRWRHAHDMGRRVRQDRRPTQQHARTNRHGRGQCMQHTNNGPRRHAQNEWCRAGSRRLAAGCCLVLLGAARCCWLLLAASQPSASQSSKLQAHMAQPHTSQPHTVQPHTAQPGIAQLSTAQLSTVLPYHESSQHCHCSQRCCCTGQHSGD